MVVDGNRDTIFIGQFLDEIPSLHGRLGGNVFKSHGPCEFEFLLPFGRVGGYEYSGAYDPDALGCREFEDLLPGLPIHSIAEGLVSPFSAQFMTGICFDILDTQFRSLVQSLLEGEFVEGV